MNQQDLSFINQKFICTDCERTYFFKNERFIRCECGNDLLNPKFQTKEINLKKDKRFFKESIKNFFACSFLALIIYVMFFWIIGGFAITGCNVKSIRGWFFADNIDPLRSSILESLNQCVIQYFLFYY